MGMLNHIDQEGNAVMVDISNKAITARIAVAKGSIYMLPETIKLVSESGLKKGDVLSVAQLAGIMGSKKTAELIPLCHQIELTSIEVQLALDQNRNAIDISATCKVDGKTGVEMEALVAVSIAALTVYDMCKAVDRGMKISDIHLVRKEGGKSGIFVEDKDG
ncbi:MAG: cyclic pyranopterin monophosphate synthase MoaC [Pseudomonadota bacterium]|nr:cyclic pyranopterin monophosphate synthase MoaC [Pseudomonadota bacterium]